jgi:hypothetical protein
MFDRPKQANYADVFGMLLSPAVFPSCSLCYHAKSGKGSEMGQRSTDRLDHILLAIVAILTLVCVTVLIVAGHGTDVMPIFLPFIVQGAGVVLRRNSDAPAARADDVEN